MTAAHKPSLRDMLAAAAATGVAPRRRVSVASADEALSVFVATVGATIFPRDLRFEVDTGAHFVCRVADGKLADISETETGSPMSSMVGVDLGTSEDEAISDLGSALKDFFASAQDVTVTATPSDRPKNPGVSAHRLGSSLGLASDGDTQADPGASLEALLAAPGAQTICAVHISADAPEPICGGDEALGALSDAIEVAIARLGPLAEAVADLAGARGALVLDISGDTGNRLVLAVWDGELAAALVEPGAEQAIAKALAPMGVGA